MEPERIAYFLAPIDQPDELARAKQEAAALVGAEVAAGDLVLVKGSLGVGMDTVVAALTRAEMTDTDH
jgi:UDP-N-acetylmuramyl pentapeptide synthase